MDERTELEELRRLEELESRETEPSKVPDVNKLAIDAMQAKMGEFGLMGKLMSGMMGIAEDPKGAAYTAAQGPTLGFSDEIVATGAQLAGVPREQALQELREPVKRFTEENPWTAAGLQIGASAPGVMGATKALSNALPRPVQQFAARHPFIASAGTGAGWGGLYGFGTGEGSAGERLPQAGSSAGFGGLFGVASLGAAKTVSAARPLTQKVENWLSKRKPQNQAQPVPTVSDIADSVQARPAPVPTNNDRAFALVEQKLRQDFPDNYDEALQAYKAGDAALIELYGNRIRSLAKGAAQYPSGKAPADKFFNERTGTAVENMKQSVSKNISPIQNYHATADEVLEKGREAAAPIYQEAFKANPSMSSKRLDAILDTPEGRDALKTVSRYYQDQMKMMGKPDPELTQIARDLAGAEKMMEQQGGVSGGLKLSVLDAVKKELDSKVRAAKRAMDMGDAAAANKYRAFEAVRKNLVDEIDNLDATAKAGPNSLKPEGGLYKQARAKSGDYLRVQSAMDEGRGFQKLDPELLGKRLAELSDGEKEAFKVGVGKHIRDIIDNQLEGRSPYNAVLGRGAQKERLMKILSPSEYRALEKDLIAENRIFEMRNEILGGSPTAGKGVAAAEIAASGLDVAEIAATQNYSSLPRQAALGLLKKLRPGIGDKTAAKVADILYETDPVKKLEILNRLGGKGSNLTVQEQALIKKEYFETEKMFKDLSKLTTAEAGASQGMNQQ